MDITFLNYESPYSNNTFSIGYTEMYKKGGNIHIKKLNRGKFTDYCGGKVTNECIRKAKASGNPTLVKRATFADNARKWKHLDGGVVHSFQYGGESDWEDLAKVASNSYILNGKLLSRKPNRKVFNDIYNYGKTNGFPYNTVIGIMANVGIESGGYPDAQQIDWKNTKGGYRYLNNGGRGIILWTDTAVPTNLIQAIFADISNPYNSQTNYWLGLNLYRNNLYKGIYNASDSAYWYRKARVRPGVFGKDKLNRAVNTLTRIYPKY